MYLSRMVAVVLVTAAVGSAGALWAKPLGKTGTKTDRAATITAVQHGSYAAPAHARTPAP
jgi:hypothetical protein